MFVPPSKLHQRNNSKSTKSVRRHIAPHIFTQGLTKLDQLVNLNLSNNYISCLANLAHLPNLQTLTLSR